MDKRKPELWQNINAQLVAKNISELQYEECFTPVLKNEDDSTSDSEGQYCLTLASGAQYRFGAWKTIWGQLRVDWRSLCRQGKPVDSAAQFYVDSQKELELTDIVLGNLLEECAQTLVADLQSVRIKQNVDALMLSKMDINCQQTYLDGHPKAVLNKGRLGWGIDDLQRYAPEFAQPFQLRWLAIDKSLAVVGADDPLLLEQMVDAALGEEGRALLAQRCVDLGIVEQQFWLLPVHPWQWQHVIQIQYQNWLTTAKMFDLGECGCRYQPLQSIRTLANLDQPGHADVKLPIRILNTSCYRGIPAKYIAISGVLSRWLKKVCEQDSLLQSSGVEVLQEPAALSFVDPSYQQIAAAPYRYYETLAVIWRDSVQAKLHKGERAMLAAALLQKDNNGDAVITCLIKESGLNPQQWFSAYCQAVVVPLYHLMCCYGVGLVAHGQNVTLIVEQGAPKRLAIKDLQGDLRIVDQEFTELDTLPEDIKSVLTRLPAGYLLHDLLTGHFVTVLRYLSALMQELGLLMESEFYQILGNRLRDYQHDYPQLQPRFAQFDLFSPSYKRVCINRVRFQQGYSDSDQRPLPTLGSDIDNPLIKAMQKQPKESRS